MKKILLISYNFSPELTGIGKYNGEMIEWLVRAGYDCSVLTAYPYYPYWEIQAPYQQKRFVFSTEERVVENASSKLKIYRCPMYVPRNPTGFKRMLLDLSFFLSALVRMIALIPTRKFDFIIAVAPSFQVGLLGVLYKKIRGAKLLYHIQDLQIEAAKDLKMIKSETVVKTMLKTEKKILDHSDLVCTISEEMANRVNKKSGKGTLLFPNWTDTQKFFPVQDRRRLKESYGFSSDDKIVMYSGAIGEKQGLESILYAAAAHRSKTNLKFIICGNGPYKDRLAELSQYLHLSNVLFFPLQPISKFNDFLNIADLHLVIQKSSASDLVMPSKLGTILAIGGLALVTANPGTALHSIVSKFRIGVVINAEDQRALDEQIAKLLREDCTEIVSNARRYAVEFLSIDRIMTRFETTFRKLLIENERRAIPQRHELVSSLTAINDSPDSINVRL